MKRKFLCLLLLTLVGCTTTSIPSYLQDKNPYKKRFYATFPEARAAVENVLSELGWKIAEGVDPLVYEQSDVNDLSDQQILLVTDVRQTPLFVGSRYARLNIFLRSQKNISEVEIRYYTVTNVGIKNFKSYGDKGAMRRIMERIEAKLGGKSLQ